MKNALLIPSVFFLNLLCAAIILAVHGGIALRYELAAPIGSGSAGLLFLCMGESVCYTFPIAFLFAVIGVYTFLMRHQAKRIVALCLFLACTLFTITIIIPICYAQLSWIRASIASYTLPATTDKALTAFIDKPFFLTLLNRGAEGLFYDMYTAYTLNFTAYLFFVCTFFFCISSFWFACVITRWNLFNLLLLLLLSGAFLLIYPYVQQEGLHTALPAIFATNTENLRLQAPLIFCVIAVTFHSIGGLKMLLLSPKVKKGVPHKNA